MERNGQCTLIKPAVSQVINGLVTWDTLSLYKGLRHVEMNNIEAVKGSKMI